MEGALLEGTDPSARPLPGGELGRTVLLIVDEAVPQRMRAPLRFACRRARATGARLELVGIMAGTDSHQALDATMASLGCLAEVPIRRMSAQPLDRTQAVAELTALIAGRPDVAAIVFGIDIRPSRRGSPLGALLNAGRDALDVEVTVVPRHMSDDEIDLIS